MICENCEKFFIPEEYEDECCKECKRFWELENFIL